MAVVEPHHVDAQVVFLPVPFQALREFILPRRVAPVDEDQPNLVLNNHVFIILGDIVVHLEVLRQFQVFQLVQNHQLLVLQKIQEDLRVENLVVPDLLRGYLQLQDFPLCYSRLGNNRGRVAEVVVGDLVLVKVLYNFQVYLFDGPADELQAKYLLIH